MSIPVWQTGMVRQYKKNINEPGFYALVLCSKLESAKKLKNWVFS